MLPDNATEKISIFQVFSFSAGKMYHRILK